MPFIYEEFDDTKEVIRCEVVNGRRKDNTMAKR